VLTIDIWARVPGGLHYRLGGLQYGFRDTLEYLTELLDAPPRSTRVSEFTKDKMVIEDRRPPHVPLERNIPKGTVGYVHVFGHVFKTRSTPFDMLRGITYILSRRSQWLLTDQQAMDALAFIESL
jgi:hypothetical protein